MSIFILIKCINNSKIEKIHFNYVIQTKLAFLSKMIENININLYLKY